MEIQIFSVGFSCSVTLKSIGVSCTLNDLLPAHDSVTWCTDHVESVGSPSYIDPARMLMSSLISLDKSECSEAFKHGSTYRFSKILHFALTTLILRFGKAYFPPCLPFFFSFEMTDFLLKKKKESSPYTQIWITVFCHHFVSSKNDVPWEKNC